MVTFPYRKQIDIIYIIRTHRPRPHERHFQQQRCFPPTAKPTVAETIRVDISPTSLAHSDTYAC